MSDIELVDVTVHFDPNLSTDKRANMEGAIRALEGVVSVHMPTDKPHLAVVEYNPARINSLRILQTVTNQDGRAELIGL